MTGQRDADVDRVIDAINQNVRAIRGEHGAMLERIGRALERHGRTLDEHGEMLAEILRRLPPGELA